MIKNKNGNKLDDDFINVISSLPQEEFFDQNGNKVEGVYKKDEPDNNDDLEDLFDEKGVKLDGKYKKILQPNLLNEELHDKDGNKLENKLMKKLDDIAGIDTFDPEGFIRFTYG